VEGLQIYEWLCQLHLDVCTLSYDWPVHERFELAAQVRRSSNSAPANLAEKHSDRHIKNRIEGINRARGEALETVHHLYIASRKGYISEEAYEVLHDRYQECVRMLNGRERTLERQLPPDRRRWPQRPNLTPDP
jgi:four helix bundle protein